MIEAACAGTVESLAAIVRPPLMELMGSESLKDGLCQPLTPLHPEEELRSIRTFVGTIALGIGQLQHTLQRSHTQWHFNHIVGRLSQLSQELTGQVEQTTSLYTLLQNHNCLDEMNRKGASYAGFFSVLPEECTLQVLSFLSERDLANVALLNRQFKRLAEDDAIWRLLSMRRWKKARDKGKDKANKRRRHAWREYFIGRRRIDANWQEGTYALRTLTGHDNQLYCVQFDEDKIVSGSEDETMKVWDIASGKCLKTLKGHTSGVWCLQFWHDRLLSGSEDSTIRLWNLETGKCEHILNGHRYGVWSLQFDDSLMVSGAEDQAIKLWDMNTLQCTNTLLGHKSDIWCLQFDAAQQMIVSGSGYEDRTLKLWDMRTGSCVMTMAGHLGAVNSLCVFYASQSHPHCILSGSADQTIKVWDRRNGKNYKFAYIWVGNSETQCPGQCAWPFHQPIYGPQSPPLVAPNNDVGLDGMVINLASLLAGTATNPFGNGYFQGPAEAPLEAASACPGVYGKGAYPGYAGNLLVDSATGASYNVEGDNGRKYLVPALYDPSTSSCSTPV